MTHRARRLPGMPRGAVLVAVSASCACVEAITKTSKVAMMGLERGRAPPASPWRVEAMLANSPPGAYFELMDPVLRANKLAYCSSQGQFYEPYCETEGIAEGYAGGGSWERVYDLETANSTVGGPHVVVFVDRGRGRSLMAIRGTACNMAIQDANNIEQCNMDICFLRDARIFGKLSDLALGDTANLSRCGEYVGRLDYYEQSVALVRRVRAALPGTELLLTGHSMGAMLASLAAAAEPEVKAVTFAPAPWHHFATSRLGWTNQTFAAMRSRNIISLCDAFDCGINSDFVEEARLGVETCLLLGVREPEPCMPYMEQMPYLTEGWRGSYMKMGELALDCMMSTHDFDRYYEKCHEREYEGSTKPNTTITCSKDFSVLSWAVARARSTKESA